MQLADVAVPVLVFTLTSIARMECPLDTGAGVLPIYIGRITPRFATASVPKKAATRRFRGMRRSMVTTQSPRKY
jgi:hypothetical protein